MPFLALLWDEGHLVISRREMLLGFEGGWRNLTARREMR